MAGFVVHGRIWGFLNLTSPFRMLNIGGSPSRPAGSLIRSSAITPAERYTYGLPSVCN